MAAIRPFIMDDSTNAQLAKVREHAEAFPMPLIELLRRVGTDQDVGVGPQFCCELPFGYRVAFTIEEHPDPLGWVRHLSVSVDEAGCFPNEWAVEYIAKAMGFTQRDGKLCILSGDHGYIEAGRAINLLQKREP